jgi:hypothetical protein
MCTGKTTPSASFPDRFCAMMHHVTTTARENKWTSGTDRTQDALGHMAWATAALRTCLQA